MEKLTVTDLGNGVWQFDEDDYVDAYLIVGQSSALLVDALMSERGLLDAVRRVTKLPLTVAITHGHGDHAGRETANFLKASIPQYLSPADLPGLEKMAGESLSGRFLPLEPGQVFDLGDRRLEAIPLPGHTVGGMAFLDRENELLFSGDGIGSGMIWMQLPGCIPME